MNCPYCDQKMHLDIQKGFRGQDIRMQTCKSKGCDLNGVTLEESEWNAQSLDQLAEYSFINLQLHNRRATQ